MVTHKKFLHTVIEEIYKTCAINSTESLGREKNDN